MTGRYGVVFNYRHGRLLSYMMKLRDDCAFVLLDMFRRAFFTTDSRLITERRRLIHRMINELMIDIHSI